MFFILSKTLYYFTMPLMLVLMAAFLGWLRRKKAPKTSRRLYRLAFVLLFIFSNRWISESVMRAWEYAPVPVDSVGHYEVAIVLGGMINQEIFPRDRVYYKEQTDRILQAVHLYKLGKVDKLFVTGGNGAAYDETREPEALLLYESLLEWGVLPSDIYLESESRNTYENALFTRQILEEQGLEGPYLLITSASHMRRSVGCFENQNLEVVPYPTDFQTNHLYAQIPANYLVPQEEALTQWRKFIKEFTGYVVYSLMGYI